MKTVGEFKKAKLKIVDGDIFADDEGNVSSCVSYSANKKTSDWDNDKVTHFAWRENTGVKPEFNGVIDAIIGVGDDSEQIECDHVDNFEWDLDHSFPTVKWRPSLNQPSVSEYDNTAQQVEALTFNSNPEVIAPSLDGFSVGYKTSKADTSPTFTQAMADAEMRDKEMFDLISENDRLKSVIRILIGD